VLQTLRRAIKKKDAISLKQKISGVCPIMPCPTTTTIRQTRRLCLQPWPKAVCGCDGGHQEFEFLQNTFWSTGYSRQQIMWTLSAATTVAPPSRRYDPFSVVFYPFSAPPVTTSAGYFPNTTYRQWSFFQENLLASFGPSKETWP
jgi:hypothetical protein